MYDWLKQKIISDANPGVSTGVYVSVTGKSGQRLYPLELRELLAGLMNEADYPVTWRSDSWIEAENGLIFLPQHVSIRELGPDAVHTVSTIEYAHPDLGPSTFFEYLHQIDADAVESFGMGFNHWINEDLPVIFDALEAIPQRCGQFQMTFPDPDEPDSSIYRRILLGNPLRHWESDTPAPDDEDHPFCACCLVREVFETLGPLLKSHDDFAVRLFASRSDDGSVTSDCRVNGIDFPAAKPALAAYAQNWLGEGIEYRKQYLFIQNDPNPEVGNS